MENRIKSLRKDILNLSQDNFAKEIGIQRNTISLFENGKRIPSNRTINDICRVFNVNKSWLKYGTGNIYVDLSNKNEIKNIINEFINDNNSIKKDILTSLLNIHDENTLKLISDIIYKFAECEH